MWKSALSRHVALLCQIGILFSAPATLISADLGVTLQWDANPEPLVVGYRAYVGTESGHYDRVFDSHSNVFVRVSPLDPGVTYYFAVSAYTSDGLESPLSDELSYAVRINGTNITLTPLTITVMKGESPVTVSFNVKPSRRYFVQTSPDLNAWRTEKEFIFATSSAAIWRDPQNTRPTRFYRVVALLP
jgi:hypothetical protein